MATRISDAIQLDGAMLVTDASGALHWPARETLIVADLHLEKGSGYAGRGHLLPPYDTATTLDRLARVLARTGAKRVVCLGDSFHDDDGPARLRARDAALLRTLTERSEWIWIAGNHDPAPPAGLGGEATEHLTCGAIVLRHRAEPRGAAFELSGHFHPKAHVKLRTRRLSARCFVSDGRRLILPAFGAYAGGLNVLDPAIDSLFPNGFRAHVIGPRAIHRFDRRALLPGPAPIADTA